MPSRPDLRWLKVAVVLLCVLLGTGCAQYTLEGRAVSMRYDPFRVAGLPATDGPSGLRGPLPESTARVQNSNGGEIDRAALAAIEDIEDFWAQHYSEAFGGQFAPVQTLVSIDPSDPNSPQVCGAEAAALKYNAAYCRTRDVLVWDREFLLPVANTFFGVMSINGVLAHEYGHAVQVQARLVDADTPTLVGEQQADCLAGTYLRWVAEGHSPQFTLNTTGDLDRVIAGAIAMRDPISLFRLLAPPSEAHGTALDRVSALQQGFDIGAEACAAMTLDEIQQRRGDLSKLLFHPGIPASNLSITEDTVATLMDDLTTIFRPVTPPGLAVDQTDCPLAEGQPARYCPDTNTVGVNLGLLRQIGTPADESEQVLLQGDNTALSAVVSRYVLALQQERGVSLESGVAAMRTACLTGVAQHQMAERDDLALTLGTGDLDEAVSGILTNGMVASDVNGGVVPSGFTRVSAFRSGLVGDVDDCFRRFP
ncbi:neutral zinc metallopeptidase [[Mycobacterium] burgundiense]|uniref:Neutral zinc metallopeptidase n=1 Tax=[Mycobacterium] burgundiense TaxID=3064286 RepID=A0ABN9NAF4_9MYCO|nr:neutral zinc metallopeptidase [Mycolicibacterium sp. MU0053]CAJ1501335.1 neutral zinc metallopeptidase [Mycolicibacterium sp. MU0053]